MLSFLKENTALMTQFKFAKIYISFHPNHHPFVKVKTSTHTAVALNIAFHLFRSCQTYFLLYSSVFIFFSFCIFVICFFFSLYHYDFVSFCLSIFLSIYIAVIYLSLSLSVFVSFGPQIVLYFYVSVSITYSISVS